MAHPLNILQTVHLLEKFNASVGTGDKGLGQKVRAKICEKVLLMVTPAPPKRTFPHHGINAVVEFHFS